MNKLMSILARIDWCIFAPVIGALICLYGCTSAFYKQVDGEVDVVGITIPDEEFIKLQVISHMNGTKTTVRDISKIKHEYFFSSTNSYFGLINVQEFRKGTIEVEPVSTNNVEVK